MSNRLEGLKFIADEFFSSVPADMQLDMERMYAAFKARIMYETHVQGRAAPEGQVSAVITDRLLPKTVAVPPDASTT